MFSWISLYYPFTGFSYVVNENHKNLLFSPKLCLLIWRFIEIFADNVVGMMRFKVYKDETPKFWHWSDSLIRAYQDLFFEQLLIDKSDALQTTSNW